MQQLEGMQMGADAYVTKPFSIQMLELQIANLLASRASMRQRYIHQVTLQPRNIEITNNDEAFLGSIIDIIDSHMDEESFGVGMLSQKMAMSQPVLYKKLKALTNMSVNDFIKSIKLKKAAMLLLTKKHTVNEVAYMVGFNDRKYFSREFKKQFGKTPSEYGAMWEDTV
jgi:AraC-like DNA-binding protein